MTPIPSTIDLTGKLPVVLYTSEGEALPTELPYTIFEANEPTVEVDCSQVKDSWESGMVDDVVMALNKFLGTDDYDIEIIGTEKILPLMIRVERDSVGWFVQPLKTLALDDPFGVGDTIQQAIDAFIRAWENKGLPSIRNNYKWVGKESMWG